MARLNVVSTREDRKFRIFIGTVLVLGIVGAVLFFGSLPNGPAWMPLAGGGCWLVDFLIVISVVPED